MLSLSYDEVGVPKNPKYYYNFTIGYVDKGALRTYDYPDGLPYDASELKCALPYGDNFVSTGTRLADGTVLLRMQKIRCGEPTPLLFDRDTTEVSVIGSMNPEALYYDLNAASEKSILSTTGRGYFVLIVGRSHHEPTDHVLRDMNAIHREEGPQLPVVALVRGEKAPESAMQKLLPSAHWGIDRDARIEKMLLQGAELPAAVDYPLVAVCDTFGRIVFVSQGYTIGIGARIDDVISSLVPPTK